MQQSEIDERRATLEKRIGEWADALTASDLTTAEKFVVDDFTILSISGELRAMDRDWWAQMLVNFRLDSFEILGEKIVQHGDQATHHRYCRMASSIGETSRTGIFCISDSWEYTPEGWFVWQRLSSPIAEDTASAGLG